MITNQKVDYPRTYHLEFSETVASDDKIQRDFSMFEGKECVVTMKMDGENTSILPDSFYARSLDSQHNYTRNWIKMLQMQLQIQGLIPEGWRLCGENMNYFHSIEYNDLEGFFYLFSVWNEKNYRLSYDDTVEFAKKLDLPMPELLYRGVFDMKMLKKLAKSFDTERNEGFVVTLADSIHYDDFRKATVKWVRKDHVKQDDEHWLKRTYPNKIGKDRVLKPKYMEYYTKR